LNYGKYDYDCCPHGGDVFLH